MKTALYRHYDASGALLYVSISRECRLPEGSSWATEVARVKTEYFPNKTKAMTAKRNAVAAEIPVHSVNYNSVATKHRSPDTVMFSARIPTALLGAMDGVALKDNITRTEALIYLLEAALKRRKKTRK